MFNLISNDINKAQTFVRSVKQSDAHGQEMRKYESKNQTHNAIYDENLINLSKKVTCPCAWGQVIGIFAPCILLLAWKNVPGFQQYFIVVYCSPSFTNQRNGLLPDICTIKLWKRLFRAVQIESIDLLFIIKSNTELTRGHKFSMQMQFAMNDLQYFSRARWLASFLFINNIDTRQSVVTFSRSARVTCKLMSVALLRTVAKDRYDRKYKYFDFVSEGITNLIIESCFALDMNYWTEVSRRISRVICGNMLFQGYCRTELLLNDYYLLRMKAML